MCINGATRIISSRSGRHPAVSLVWAQRIRRALRRPTSGLIAFSRSSAAAAPSWLVFLQLNLDDRARSSSFEALPRLVCPRPLMWTRIEPRSQIEVHRT